MKILIAEDEPTGRLILERHLARWGHEVVPAHDGEEAWQYLQGADAPLLAILDWVMPGYNGVDLCRMVRERADGERFYLILLTARDSKDDIVAGLEAGANDYIGKPFHPEELRARIRAGQRMLEMQAALESRISALEEAMRHIKRLQGILPICMHCHKIRTDQASWERIETYITEHSEAQFSHGLCPDCIKQYYKK